MARTIEELLEYADEHLFYEIWMASEMTKRLRRHAALFERGLSVERDGKLASELLDPPGRNADIESFATHVRVLVQFLYPHKPKPSDIVAAAYFDRESDWSAIRPKRPQTLLKANERVPVEIGHLGFGRVRRKNKEWPYDAIWADLATVVGVFIDNVPSHSVSAEFRKEVKALLPGAASPKSLDELISELDRTTIAARTGATTMATQMWRPPFDPYPEDSASGGTVILPPRRDASQDD
jgi:hypothetical protein